MFRITALLAMLASVFAQQNITIGDESSAFQYSPAVGSGCLSTGTEVLFCNPGWSWRIAESAPTFTNQSVHTACGAGYSVSLNFQASQLFLQTSLSGLGTKINITIDGQTVDMLDTFSNTSMPYVWASPQLDGAKQHTFVATTGPVPSGVGYACFDLDGVILTTTSNLPVAPDLSALSINEFIMLQSQLSTQLQQVQQQVAVLQNLMTQEGGGNSTSNSTSAR